MDYDASIVADGVTIGFRKTEGVRYVVLWEAPGEPPTSLGEYDAETLRESANDGAVLPDGRKVPPGSRAWVNGDRAALIPASDWARLCTAL